MQPRSPGCGDSDLACHLPDGKVVKDKVGVSLYAAGVSVPRRWRLDLVQARPVRTVKTGTAAERWLFADATEEPGHGTVGEGTR
jgi:hypothetical protein